MKGFKNWFVFGLAAVAFLAPLKFGTPVMLQAHLQPPGNSFEWLFFSWPNELAVILIFAAFVWLVLDPQRMLARVDLLFVLPLMFLLTQTLAAPTTICRQTTVDTLMLFAACGLLFYVGAWYVRDGAAVEKIFAGMGLATALVVVCALDQRYGFFGGGFEETRAYAASHLKGALPPEYLLRMSSNRVFAWFGGYPNALAGFLIITFAPTLAWIWVRARSWDIRMKWITLVFAAGVMVFCLVLTGSRGGFMAFGVMVATVLKCWDAKGRRRPVIVATGVVVVLAVVFMLGLRGGFIHLGTKSLGARLDYWRGAVAIAKDHPWVGTGPGTFGSIYPKYKTALTEEARTVHNSYLQMWSDSGLPAFVVFALLWAVAVRDAFRLTRRRAGDTAALALCGALTGWAFHSLVDFDLYVPGVALPTFVLLGAVQGLKELPRTDTVTPRRRANWLMGAACGAMLAAVLWIEGRALAAGFASARAQELEAVDPRAALEEAKRAAKLSPWNPRLESGVGRLALAVGRRDEGIAAYREAVELDPYRASGWWRLAEAKKAAHGIDAEVLQILRRTVELNPMDSDYSNALAAAEKSVRQAPASLLESDPAKESGFSK